MSASHALFWRAILEPETSKRIELANRWLNGFVNEFREEVSFDAETSYGDPVSLAAHLAAAQIENILVPAARLIRTRYLGRDDVCECVQHELSLAVLRDEAPQPWTQPTPTDDEGES